MQKYAAECIFASFAEEAQVCIQSCGSGSDVLFETDPFYPPTIGIRIRRVSYVITRCFKRSIKQFGLIWILRAGSILVFSLLSGSDRQNNGSANLFWRCEKKLRIVFIKKWYYIHWKSFMFCMHVYANIGAFNGNILNSQINK